MSERCEVTDLEKDGCAHCNVPKTFTFPAVYRGHCVTCRGDIFQGDKIRDRGDGEYEHARHR